MKMIVKGFQLERICMVKADSWIVFPGKLICPISHEDMRGDGIQIYSSFHSTFVWGAVCSMHTFVDRSKFCPTKVTFV